MGKAHKKNDVHPMMKLVTDKLRQYVDHVHGGNTAAATEALGLKPPILHTWLNGSRCPSLAQICPVLEKLQARIVFPGELPQEEGKVFIDYAQRCKDLEDSLALAKIALAQALGRVEDKCTIIAGMNQRSGIDTSVPPAALPPSQEQPGDNGG